MEPRVHAQRSERTALRFSDGDDFYTCHVTIKSDLDGYMRISTETNAIIAMTQFVYPPVEDIVHLEKDCSICHEEYVEGSNFVELKKCRHCFHGCYLLLQESYFSYDIIILHLSHGIDEYLCCCNVLKRLFC